MSFDVLHASTYSGACVDNNVRICTDQNNIPNSVFPLFAHFYRRGQRHGRFGRRKGGDDGDAACWVVSDVEAHYTFHSPVRPANKKTSGLMFTQGNVI